MFSYLGPDDLGDASALEGVIKHNAHRGKFVDEEGVVDLVSEKALENREPFEAYAFDEAGEGEVVVKSVGHINRKIRGTERMWYEGKTE